MILSEPGHTQADLHFRIGDVPVRVHPMFWLLPLFLSGGAPKSVVLSAIAVFVSILFHELGHAVFQLRYGGRPRIVLYAMGGLAIGEGVRSSPQRQIAISLAGPFAGFLLAFLLAVVLWAAGKHPYFDFHTWMIRFDPLPNLTAWELIDRMFYINIFWGLFNLLPVYPLDGGQVARELFTLWLPPVKGIVVSLWVSIVTAAAAALYFFPTSGGGRPAAFLPVLLFGLLAYSSYQTLQAYQGNRRDSW